MALFHTNSQQVKMLLLNSPVYTVNVGLAICLRSRIPFNFATSNV